MELQLDIDLSLVTRQLSRLENGVQRVEGFLTDVGEAALREFGRIMDTEGLGQWPKLDSKTQRTKDRLGVGNRPILFRTGAMRESFTRRGARFNIFERRRMSLDVGSSIPYAHQHQRGNALHPSRPIVFMTDVLRREIERIAIQYLCSLTDG